MVAEYEDDELADDSDDKKKLFKAEAWVGKKKRLQLAKSKTAKSAFRKPGGWWHRLPAGVSANPNVSGWSVQSPATYAGSSTTPQVAGSQLGPCFVEDGAFKKIVPRMAEGPDSWSY